MFRPIFSLFLCALIISCAQVPTHYTIDPEFDLSPLSEIGSKSFTLTVIPPTTHTPGLVESDKPKTHTLAAQNNFETTIKKNLVSELSRMGHRISSNPHFADYQLTFDFSEIKVTIEKGLVVDQLSVEGEVDMAVTKKANKISKRFTRTQTLKVPLNSNQAEITGLTNQVISALVKQALNDESIDTFMKKYQ